MAQLFKTANLPASFYDEVKSEAVAETIKQHRLRPISVAEMLEIRWRKAKELETA